jgi:catabolite regulation protein CreA
MYGSRNDKISLSNVPDNISSSSIHTDQDQEEQSSVQREGVKSACLGKLVCPVSEIGTSTFGRTKNCLAEEDDQSTSCSDVDNDDDDTDDEYDEQERLVEFKKLISKHMKLQRDMEISYIPMKILLTYIYC